MIEPLSTAPHTSSSRNETRPPRELVSELIWSAATRRGARRVNADAVASRVDPDSHGVVVALADGIGDQALAAQVARAAVDASARTSCEAGPVEAVLAAQRVLRTRYPAGGDCVLVVAMPFPGCHRLAWVGNCRAYRWDADTLEQVSADQTMAEHFRVRHQQATPRMEHVITNTVRTTLPEDIRWTEVNTVHSGLMLSSDGVHRVLAESVIHSVLVQPRAAIATPLAACLVDTALRLGGRDNASAVVAEHSSTPHLPTPRTPGHRGTGPKSVSQR
jgi:serine/threonine protein phosphatase PrpC